MKLFSLKLLISLNAYILIRLILSAPAELKNMESW